MEAKQPFICFCCPGGWGPGGVPDEQASFDEYMWTLIRLWCDAALASMQREGRCYSFSHAWSSICLALGRGYLGRRLTYVEAALVWNGLIDAGYPDQRARKVKGGESWSTLLKNC